jgi:hypothetical protein
MAPPLPFFLVKETKGLGVQGFSSNSRFGVQDSYTPHHHTTICKVIYCFLVENAVSKHHMHLPSIEYNTISNIGTGRAANN